ncbi:MAG: cytochrome c [Gammaproteobacteria bacterium]
MAVVSGVAAIGLAGCMGSDNRSDSSGLCPQPRDTEMASAYIASKLNPLAPDRETINAGEELFQNSADPVACAQCHGTRGDGNGPMAKMFDPSPRNFTCAQTMTSIPDGQLYWIIKNGSIGTSMPAFNKLNDNEIWQLVSYVREFSREAQKLTKK